ncbi:hypothetical protein [Roseiconus lacunae]|uniref:hypothetical protein n=1 Tax=Roseiconus lacunae TaxID=2605694 RepID=UPI001E3F1B97|nr:hypothetical protein [Roseiconus lacunae]MCD0458658.1 hypothetical protein [Roseiconus lacunae]
MNNNIYKSSSDIHIAAGLDSPVDPIAAQQSCEIDAARDREWFRENPGQQERIRKPSIREIMALALPPGTEVKVRRGPHGSQIREFI